MKKTYNTLTDEQVSNMVEKIIRVSDFQITSDNLGLMIENFGDSFFYLYDDEYTLGGMSKQQAETFVNNVYSYTEDFLLEYMVD